MNAGCVYLTEGGASLLPVLSLALKREGFAVSGVDAYVRTYKQFGITEARELRERALLRPVSSSCRVFILAVSTMTVEAQNALLKTFEETPAGATFFLVVPSPDMLLATLRSRTRAYELNVKNSNGDMTSRAEQFLKASLEKRLDMLKLLLEKDDEDQHDVGKMTEFLASLERALSVRGAHPALRALYRARMYLNDRGSLKKILLEQVALLIPSKK